MNMQSPVGAHLIAVENTPQHAQHGRVHAVLLLSVGSAGPAAGLVQIGALSQSRAVIEPRGVLADFGVTLPQDTQIRVWDSTAETRFIVLPMRPAGTDGWSEEQLADLVTRDSMIGTGLAKTPASRDPMNSIHDLGGMHGFGPVEPEPNEPTFHAPWEGRVAALYRAMGFARLWTIDAGRAMIESLPPATYLTASYYAKWLMGLERSVERAGLVGADEIAAGRSLRPASYTTRGDGAAPMSRASSAATTRGRPRRPRDSRPATASAPSTSIPPAHTRLPRYARGKTGTVEAVRGCHVYPDTAAIGAGEQSAMALHGRVRRRANCGATAPTRR